MIIVKTEITRCDIQLRNITELAAPDLAGKTNSIESKIWKLDTTNSGFIVLRSGIDAGTQHVAVLISETQLYVTENKNVMSLRTIL